MTIRRHRSLLQPLSKRLPIIADEHGVEVQFLSKWVGDGFIVKHWFVVKEGPYGNFTGTMHERPEYCRRRILSEP